MELANDCFKFPLLFSINLEKVLEELKFNKTCIRELLDVLLQLASNTYLHQVRLYTQAKKAKKVADSILNDCLFKTQKTILRISVDSPTKIYSTWIPPSIINRRWAVYRDKFGSSHSSPDTYQPEQLLCKTKNYFIRAVLHEQKGIWRAKEGKLLHSLSSFYREPNLNNFDQNHELVKERLLISREKYALINN